MKTIDNTAVNKNRKIQFGKAIALKIVIRTCLLSSLATQKRSQVWDVLITIIIFQILIVIVVNVSFKVDLYVYNYIRLGFLSNIMRIT